MFSYLVTVLIILYFFAKPKYINKLIEIVVMLHLFFTFFTIYPMISSVNWGEDFWIWCLSCEVCLIIYSLTFFRQDLRTRKIYEALNNNHMFSLFGGKYSKLTQSEIEHLSRIIKSIFALESKYKIPFNILLVNTVKEKLDCTLIFFNRDDYHNFIAFNEGLAIEEIHEEKRGVWLRLFINFSNDNINYEEE